MEIWQWLLFASMFAVGGLIGYTLARGKSDNMGKVRELESQLADSEKKLDEYKTEVSQHFGKTAQLFNNLTDDYRAVYEHLAAGSQALCGDKVDQLVSELPDKKLLDAEPEKVKDAEVETKKEEPEAVKEPVENSESSEKTEESTEAPAKESTPENAARAIH